MREFDFSKIPKLSTSTISWKSLLFKESIDLEIGAGAGLHAIQYAQSNPRRTLIALERTTKIDRLKSRLKFHPEIENVVAIRADAIHWIVANVPPSSLSRVFILYPNPYPKQRQKNLRWPNMPFMKFLIERLKPNGTIELATNSASYVENSLQSFQEVWKLEILSFDQIKGAYRPRTHFEKKYLERNQPCWNLLVRKPVSP